MAAVAQARGPASRVTSTLGLTASFVNLPFLNYFTPRFKNFFETIYLNMNLSLISLWVLFKILLVWFSFTHNSHHEDNANP